MHQSNESRLVQYRRGQARYVPLSRIAAGGMAEVWKGEAHFQDGHMEHVAIKRVLPAFAKHDSYRRMLEDEARIGKLLRHPNIVRVFDAREVRSTYIMVMELVDGASLREINGRLMERQSHVPVAASLHIAREVARALEHAHEAIDDMGRELGIIHRDVSPHNVMLDVHGRVKLMDFGLANSSANLSDRDPSMIGGKFGYLSPELVLRQESSHLLDLFALGVMLWESLTGQRLFQGKDDAETVRKVARCEVPAASSINPNVSAELDQVLAAMLAKRPEERYQSARELGADLDYLLEGEQENAGAGEVSALVRLHQAAQQRARQHHTGSISTPTVSGVVPSRPAVSSASLPPPGHFHSRAEGPASMLRTTISGTGQRIPRLTDSLADDLDALANAPVRATMRPPGR